MLAMAPIVLRNINPIILEEEEKMQELIEDLTRMWCKGLLTRPWLLQNKAMVRELVDGPEK